MNRIRRALMLIALAISGAVPQSLAADTYPTKPIRIIVPWPAGGITDARVRLLSDSLAKAVGQPVVVENKPGASGTLGAQLVAGAAPDGYTLLAGSFVDQAVALGLFRQLPYDPERDFVPVVNYGRGCLLLFVHSSVKASTLDEFLAIVRAKPGQLQYASAGVGTPQHLLMERLKKLAGIDLSPVHYKGGGPALQDVVAGHLPVMFEFAPTMFPHAKAGKVKPLVAGCNHRVDLYPDVPSAEEAGFPWLELISWGGLFAPRGTPAEIVQRINREINKIIVAPDVRSHIAMAGSDYPLWTPEQFADFVRTDRPRWSEVMKVAGIEPQ